MENLLFATEERLPSPDSVRSLYHVAGGQVKHNPLPRTRPTEPTAAGRVRGKAWKGHSRCHGVPPEIGVTPLSDVSYILNGSASL